MTRDNELKYLRKQEIKGIKRTLEKLHAKRSAYLERSFRAESVGDKSEALHFGVLADNVAREIDAENIALLREKTALQRMEKR